MTTKRLESFLENEHVDYKTIQHPVAFSSLEISEVADIPEQNLAKTVIVKTPTRMLMAVIPANELLNIEWLKEELEEPHLSLATEQEFTNEFPDCEIGAMPPFGNLYNMDVIVSDHLAEDEWIAFNAGNHSELIRLSYKDYEKMVHPKVLHISH